MKNAFDYVGLHMYPINKGPVYQKSYEFALKVIILYQELIRQKEYVLSKQLLRSGISIGANINEATAAQSRKDFISKMSIASKEARETKYWLNLLSDSKIAAIDCSSQIILIDELIRILTAIVKTSRTGETKN